ncbi:hypothetical protein [Chitinophaga sp. XS-30]|uniref:hypothetical protein n=1 Tax=Chitinophaga sp. XS-30 TaxID=2604421 RepID=UPI00143CDDEE|nr:hypothetical protein [Chitinophaga sp. XS-30]
MRNHKTFFTKKEGGKLENIQRKGDLKPKQQDIRVYAVGRQLVTGHIIRLRHQDAMQTALVRWTCRRIPGHSPFLLTFAAQNSKKNNYDQYGDF